MPSPIEGTGDAAVNKTGKYPGSHRATIRVGKTDDNKMEILVNVVIHMVTR